MKCVGTAIVDTVLEFLSGHANSNETCLSNDIFGKESLVKIDSEQMTESIQKRTVFLQSWNQDIDGYIYFP